MKPLLIVNPRSAGGKTGETFGRMRPTIERYLGEVDVLTTGHARHAVELARDAALDGRETVIAVGGDGSIHEVVNGLMQAQEQGAKGARLGILGQGTGGDFRKSLRLEHRLDRYCQAIADGRTRRCDVGRYRCKGHDGHDLQGYFINILSAGLGGLVDRYVAESRSRFGGTVAYFLASARALIESEIGVVRITRTLDDHQHVEEVRTRLIALCNGQYFGSGMHIAPMAQLEDGVLEVVDLGATSTLQFALSNSKVYSGKHLELPEVSHERGERIRLELLNQDAADTFLLDIDGEPAGRLPLEVEIVPRALDILAPV